MAFNKRTLFLAILCFLLIQELEIYVGIQHTVGAQKIDCAGKCNYRCSKASRPNRCLRACNTCCERCNCVPPGTSGNTEVCPCYANMETDGGKKKCP
ncbi:PREDICTED: gibberellin-regulated protein 3-like [Lupinus angustifolius]|uniref:gibberellin-regulated protein 3-like n=1 Tax=Lupinus angustifolius TaxID=3871 RepID=UPI00092F3EB6|nr:PREDICTED: gibberellin-regulated protein 3-like [Lupinus angustifolius]